MKSVEQVLSEIRALGAELTVEGESLRFNGAKGTLSPDLLSLLRERKPELVAFLRDVGEASGAAAENGKAANEEEKPRTPTERSMTEIWTQVLDLDSLDIHANFFDLGGYSRLGAEIVESVNNTLGVRMALKDLFLNPTVAGSSAFVDRIRESCPVEVNVPAHESGG